MIGPFKPPRLLKLAGTCSLATWLSAAGVFLHFDATRPEAPNRELGQIYELNNHGHVFYVSFRDGVLFYGLMLVGITGIFTTLVIERRLRESRRSSPAQYQ